MSLRCDCGRPALRTVRYLRTLKEGVTPMCRACLRELRAGMFVDASSKKKSLWLDVWENTGSLYSAAWEKRITDELREALGVEPPTPTIPEPDLSAVSTPGSAGHGSLIVPIGSDSGWSCERCQAPFGEGYACLLCALVFCEECVHQHEEDRSRGLTLQEIATITGKSRERVRQEIERAIRKLRHPTRSRLLKEFVDDGFEPYTKPKAHTEEKERPPLHCGKPLSATASSRYCSICGRSFPVHIDIYEDDSMRDDFTSGCISRVVADLNQRAGDTRNKILLFRHGGQPSQRWRLARSYMADGWTAATLGHTTMLRGLALGAVALWNNGLLQLDVAPKTLARHGD